MSEPTEILAAVPDGLQYFVNHPPYASDVSTRKRRKTQAWNYGRWVQELPLKYGIWSKKAKHQLWELTLKHIQNDPNFTPQHKSFAAKTLHQVNAGSLNVGVYVGAPVVQNVTGSVSGDVTLFQDINVGSAQLAEPASSNIPAAASPVVIHHAQLPEPIGLQISAAASPGTPSFSEFDNIEPFCRRCCASCCLHPRTQPTSPTNQIPTFDRVVEDVENLKRDLSVGSISSIGVETRLAILEAKTAETYRMVLQMHTAFQAAATVLRTDNAIEFDNGGLGL